MQNASKEEFSAVLNTYHVLLTQFHAKEWKTVVIGDAQGKKTHEEFACFLKLQRTSLRNLHYYYNIIITMF